MWEKFNSVLTPDYVTVKNHIEALHFYVRGVDCDAIADALVDNLNTRKKSKLLRVVDVVGEIAFLKNSNVLGCAGVPKQIKNRNEMEYDNSERREFLKKTIRGF